MKATLQTIADAVGVSRSTVSNAYSRPDQLSPDLREKIFEAARELGYAGPHPAARSLRRGRAGAIGVLFTATTSIAFTDPYAVQFLRGLAEAVERKQIGLLLVPLLLDDEAAAVDAVRNAAVDGFCIYCMPDSHPSLDAMRSRGLPVVNTGHGPDNSMRVGVDEAASTRTAGEYLMGLGHRRVAVIADFIVPDRVTGPVALRSPDDVDHYDSRERIRGYLEAFDAAGVDRADVMFINAVGNSRSEGEKAAAYALDREDRPSAVVAVTDLFALGVLDAVNARGLRPGPDISVIGFDDIPQAAAEGLTTVRQPAVERGRIAGELLLDPPENPADWQVVLPTELMIRASTGPVSEG